MTEKEWDALNPGGVKDTEESKIDTQPQKNDDVDGDRHTPADFDDGAGHDDESIHSGEPGEPEPTEQESVSDQDVDERGVSWKNRAKEYERKLAALEVQQSPSPEAVPSPELPPSLPPSPQQVSPQGQQQPVESQLQQPSLPTDWDEVPGYLKQMEIRMSDTFEAKASLLAEQKARQVFRQQQTEQQIVSDYPDIRDPASPLFQWTQYELKTRYGSDPRFIEEATMRAAIRLNIQAGSKPQAMQSQQKPLPRVNAQPPASERGTSAARQESKVKLSPESIRAAKAFGQNTKDLEAMVKRQQYAFSNGQSMFED